MNKKIPPEGGSVATVNYNSIFEQTQKVQDQIQADLSVRPEIVIDEKHHRFSSSDAKPRANNCWYMAKIDMNGILVCHYKNWSTGLNKTAFGSSEAKPQTKAERLALIKEIKRKNQERRKAERQAQLATKKEAQALWEQARKSDFEHQYLVNKQVGNYGLVKLKQQLLIPMCDAKGVLWNFQRIYPNGKKFYLKNGRILGLFHTIGKPENNEQCVIRVAEGYATAASIHQVTGDAVIVAFSTANLMPVCLAIKRFYPLARIIVCGDDDRFSTGINAGRAYATKAAETIRAEVVFPEFPPECTTGTDFNDLINWEAEHGKS